jgi:hypothetical protein
MNEEQQRIAIAEACGLINVRMWSESCIASMGVSDEGKYWGSLGVPDYLNDLNAMHEAVKTLPQNIKPRYFACLCFVVRGAISLNGYSKATEATAAQRAEAFLRTIDKWTTNPNEL